MRLFRSFNGNTANPRLEGAQVYARAPVDRDWQEYAELRAASRRFLEPWEPTWPSDALMRDAFVRRLRRYSNDWRDDLSYNFLLFHRENDRLVGGISLSNVRRGVAQAGSLGYWIGEPYARSGHMTDGLRAMLDFSFRQLGLHRVEAACLPANEASQRLLRRCGFRQEGYAAKLLKICGEWQDHLMFALLAEQFSGSESAGGGSFLARTKRGLPCSTAC